MSRALLFGIAAAALAGPTCNGSVQAEDATYAIGRQGWSLELFGAEVSLLRSNSAAGQSADEAVLILSCDGRERRMQLSFPARNTPPVLATIPVSSPGNVLIRAVDRVGIVTSSLSAPFVTSGKATMVVADQGMRGAPDSVLRVARMLQSQPIGFDLLLRQGPAPVALGRASPLRLSLAFGVNDRVAFDTFVKACT